MYFIKMSSVLESRDFTAPSISLDLKDNITRITNCRARSCRKGKKTSGDPKVPLFDRLGSLVEYNELASKHCFKTENLLHLM